MKLLKLACLSSLACAVFTAHAAEPLTAEVELGVIATSGNTESTSLKGKLKITQELENWKNNYQLDTLYKKDEVTVEDDAGNDVTEEQTTAQKLFVSAQGDYKLNDEHAALFIYGSYTDDRFSGYDYQSVVAAGYTDQLFTTTNSFLKYDIGPGYTFNETDDGEKNESAIVRLAAEYQYKLSANAKFSQLLSTEAALESSENTRTKSETSVSANLMGNLSMKAAYTVIHNSEVPANKEKTDTMTSVTLVYIF
ncbi:DUF481 domain-containing protein [Catenovulum sp. 2E275]|uniref:DUF481 domain-containing protein n=1 Tax=Catenovulum sp. 2E275 TaxID=2980497 RepID=UPI0021D183D1|nr:DUF481 domain-containing protein [Catenovulum sp. 2E275]MCU4676592.1 DUF481 domain-containing protein [Catenovulum sp. 2E275]